VEDCGGFGAAESEVPDRGEGRCCLSTGLQPGGLRVVRVQRPLCLVP